MAYKYIDNFLNEDLNPCIEESKLSYVCLENELYDYSKCSVFFYNYKICQTFWAFIKYKRKAAGILPVLPTKEEREKILELKKKGIFKISVED